MMEDVLFEKIVHYVQFFFILERRKHMLKVLAKYIKEYKLASLLTIVFIIGEVIFELLIPYMMTFIIDKGVAINDFNAVIKYGSIMIALAVLGLICGIAAGIYGANASAGFAKNLREGMFHSQILINFQVPVLLQDLQQI